MIFLNFSMYLFYSSNIISNVIPQEITLHAEHTEHQKNEVKSKGNLYQEVEHMGWYLKK